MRSTLRATAPVLALVAIVALSGCGKDSASTTKAAGQHATVTAGDTTCALSADHFSAGELAFEVENTGKDVTEVYVYGKGSDGDFDKVVGEVENIAPGAKRDFEVEVGGGDYEVACKPGQKGDGIRTRIEVSGTPASSTAAAYDREVEVTATEFAFEGLKAFTAKAGEKIEFKLENAGHAPHNLVVVGPSGDEVGEVDTVAPGKDGEAVITLATAGTYTFSCTVDGHADKGMAGTFTVS